MLRCSTSLTTGCPSRQEIQAWFGTAPQDWPGLIQSEPVELRQTPGQSSQWPDTKEEGQHCCWPCGVFHGARIPGGPGIQTNPAFSADIIAPHQTGLVNSLRREVSNPHWPPYSAKRQARPHVTGHDKTVVAVALQCGVLKEMKQSAFILPFSFSVSSDPAASR